MMRARHVNANSVVNVMSLIDASTILMESLRGDDVKLLHIGKGIAY